MGLYRFILSPTRYLLGFIGFYWVLLGFTGFHCVSQGFAVVNRSSVAVCTESRCVIDFTLDLLGFYWAHQISTAVSGGCF